MIECFNIKSNMYGFNEDFNIVNINTGYVLKRHKSEDGYDNVRLMTRCNKPMTMLHHRVLMQTINPIENPEDYTVNHKDGIKDNNVPDNLEWDTNQENVIHAIMNGLDKNRARGERQGSAKISDETVEKICEAMETNYFIEDINNYVKERYNQELPSMDIRSLVSKIRRGSNWTHISKKYNIMKDNPIVPIKYTEDDVHVICKVAENVFYIDDIIDTLKCDYGMIITDKVRFKKFMEKLRAGIRWRSISKNYKLIKRPMLKKVKRSTTIESGWNIRITMNNIKPEFGFSIHK